MNRWSISKRTVVTLGKSLPGFRYQLQLVTPEGAVFQWKGCLVGISPERGPWTQLPKAGRYENCVWNQRAEQICLDALRDAGVLDELVSGQRETQQYQDLEWAETS